MTEQKRFRRLERTSKFFTVQDKVLSMELYRTMTNYSDVACIFPRLLVDAVP